MQKKYKFLFMMIAASLLSSCATLFGNNNRQISVNSTPTGANVYLNTIYQGMTPTKVTIANIKIPNIIQIQKPNYFPITTTVNTSFQYVTVLDALFWPTLFIDSASGDMVKISSSSRNINVNLVPSHT